MRKVVLVCVLALVLGGIFYFFVMRSPTQLDVADLAPRTTTRKVVPTTIAALDSSVPVGRSNDVWAQSIDAKTQRIINEFSSDDVAPRPDGSVDVVRPRARFYGRNNGIVTLEGSTGHVFYTQAGERNDSKALGTSTPTSGELRDVTIRFFEKTLEEDPTIVVTVPAVRFDANSNRISTIDCVVKGQGYAAEQVPVTMRGRDFDFDGQGLSVAWNDRAEMLDQLEITKGNRLLVRDISKFIGEEVVSIRPQPEAAPSLAQALFGVVMVQATQEAAPAQDLYYATFEKDVQVLKGGEEVATGEQMRCVIPLGQSARNTQSSREPSTRKARREQSTTRRTENPATAPATQPMPLEIRWTGRLLIRPARVVQEVAQTQMVELIGNPAKVSEKGTSATGRLIRVEAEAGRVSIEPGGNVRAIEVQDATGARLRSRSPLRIDESTGSVTIDGGGALNVPAGQNGQGPLAMTWSKRLDLLLSNDKPGHLQRISVDGDTKVDSDRIKLTCASLALTFDAPAPAVATESSGSRFSMPSPDLSLLRRIDARGDASCRMEQGETSRTLAAQNIQLGFVGGEQDALLTSILCDGDVGLVDGEKLNLEAGKLNVQTKPLALAGSDTDLGGDFFDLVTSLNAQQAVRIKRADGSSLEGDELDLAGEGAAKRLVVSGVPAVLQSPKGALRGNRVELDPATGDIHVPTAGSFAGTNPDRPGTDVAIGWDESMTVVGKTGACDFIGAVKITGHDDKGSELLAYAKRGRAQFGVAETTTQPAESGLAGLRFDSIRSLTLDGGVNLAVTTTDARSSSMDTETLDIDLVGGTLRAPKAGQMLLVDQRKNADTGKNQFGPGALAMRWKESLNWDMRGGNLAMLGGVRVGFEREGSNDPVRITCNKLTGIVTPVDTSNGFDQMTPRIDLKLLKAEGDVAVRSKSASFDSADLVYDLQTQLAAAHGTDSEPVQVFDASGSSRIGFSSITWNLKTGLIEDFRDITGQIRR